MNGFDALSSSIKTNYNVDLYVPMAIIPKYLNDSNWTQGHKYIIEIVELSKFMNSTRLAIYTSNSSTIIGAYYIGMPQLDVVISDEDNYYRVLVKPQGLYSAPIGIRIVSGENPASIVCLNGYIPIVDITTITSIPIGYKGVDGQLKMNLKKDELVAEFISSAEQRKFNYSVTYNTFGSADKTITPSTSISAIWYITYKEGQGTTGPYAIQTWECIKDTTYYKYVRQKTSNTEWGQFIQVN